MELFTLGALPVVDHPYGFFMLYEYQTPVSRQAYALQFYSSEAGGVVLQIAMQVRCCGMVWAGEVRN